MTNDDCPPVSVSRRIAAPAADIFRLLADPRRHLELDGSGMLRGAVTERPVTGTGQTFTMRMYFERLGDYSMVNHVVEFEPDRLIGWEPESGADHPDKGADGARWGHRWSYRLAPDGPDATVVTESYDCSTAPAEERATMDGGRCWIPAMTATLERLDQLCAHQGTAPASL